MGVERLSDAFKDDARKEIPAKSFFLILIEKMDLNCQP